MKKDKLFYYSLGQRDAIASALAIYEGKIKLNHLAQDYRKIYGEEHFSHKWHTK